MGASYFLRLFGTATLAGPSGPVTGNAVQQRPLALLALLAVARGAGVGREKLVGWLWPEHREEHARHRLSDVVYLIRRSLGDHAIVASGDTLLLNEQIVASDASAFIDARESENLEGAVEWYTGPFLDGFSVRGAPEFERWLDGQRRRFADDFAHALQSLATASRATADHATAERCLRRLLAHDPFNSRVALELIETLVESGDPVNARLIRRDHERVLRDELEVEPSQDFRDRVSHVFAEGDARRTVAKGLRSDGEAVASSVVKPADQLSTAAFTRALTAPLKPSRPRWMLPMAVTAVITLAAAGVWALVGRGDGAAPRFDRLAVLPFTNFTGRPDETHFVDAMHDAVIAKLAQIHALTVISRQSVLRYKDTDKAIPEIARELGVDVVAEGSVFRQGDTVRITLQLLKARPKERHLWVQTYQRDISQLLALHGQIAQAIAQQIDVAVTPQELDRLEQARPVNPAAYEAWLRGWVESTRLNGPASERCIAHANDAISIDGSYAPAHALAARCYRLLAVFTRTAPEDAFPKAKAAALRAIELDPSLAEAHSQLAVVLDAYEWDWAGAARAHERALELAPRMATSHVAYAFFLSAMGRHDAALEHALQAQELSPALPGPNSAVTIALYCGRRYEQALAQAQQAVDLFPNNGYSNELLAWVLEALGEYDQAVSAWERAVALDGAVYPTAFLGRTYALAGRRHDALRVLDTLLTEASSTYVPPLAIALLYDGLGLRDQAIQWFERSYDRRDRQMLWLNTWPALDPIRLDPRFQRLIRRMKFPV